MQKGGYQIIDLQNKNLQNGVGMVYEGIYEKIEGTRKPILISGFTFNGTEYRDFFAICGLVGTTYYVKYEAPPGVNLSISFSDTDVVTVTPAG